MRGAVAPALRYVVRVPDDRRRALSDGGPRRRELPARGIPQPQPRRPLLLLGIRSQTQHTGRTRRIPAVRLAGPGRPGNHTSVRADLRARRPHPVLSRYAGLGGAGGHPAHYQHLSGLFLGSAIGDRKGFCWKRRLLLTPGSGDNAARHGAGGGEPVKEELEFRGRSRPGVSRQPHSFARAAAAGGYPAEVRAAARGLPQASLRKPRR